MSHSFGSGNSSQNTYLNKKRLEDDIPIEPRYHYDKYSKYNSHSRYNPMNYMHSKSQGNAYYNSNPRYRSNYYNPQNYKYGPKRDFKKSYQKYSGPNSNDGIRNLSNCDMTPSPPPLSLKKSNDSISTRYDSKTNLTETNGNSININNLNKLVSNITSHIPQSNHNRPIYHNGQQNINIQIELTPDSLRKDDYSNSKRKKSMEEAKNEEDDIVNVKFPKKSEKLLNFEPFDRSLVKIEENPLDNFDLYPKNLFGNNNINGIRKNNLISLHDYTNNYFIENNLGIKSCYLLAKIPNWRLVTNFVPASELNEEKFDNILPLDEGKGEGKEKNMKSFLVYDEKYEEIVEKYLEQNMAKSNQTEKAVFNFKFIIASFHYDILKIKNKINKTKFKINYLTIKQENSRNAIEQQFKV